MLSTSHLDSNVLCQASLILCVEVTVALYEHCLVQKTQPLVCGVGLEQHMLILKEQHSQCCKL